MHQNLTRRRSSLKPNTISKETLICEEDSLSPKAFTIIEKEALTTITKYWKKLQICNKDKEIFH
jgi:hypothetical protein